MRFLVLSRADIIVVVMLNRLLPVLARQHTVRVYLSDRTFPGERGSPPADLFMRNTRDIWLDSLFPALDQRQTRPFPAGGKGLMTFQGLSRAYDVPMEPLGGEVTPAQNLTRNAVREWRPDVILSCRHDFIVPHDVWCRALGGAYNTHLGNLPDYRGPSCLFWTMYNREVESACTLHWLADLVDRGPVVARSVFRLDYGESLLHNMITGYMAGIETLLSLLPRLSAGPLPGQPQSPGVGRYYPPPDPETYAAFAARGGKVTEEQDVEDLQRRFF
ncbi:MAG: hypothetical protein LBU79_07065 [Planctomycetota bacterium]|jgi:hypothetical protein|nr:hypothetical protein [Planctomycetota bacterium]